MYIIYHDVLTPYQYVIKPGVRKQFSGIQNTEYRIQNTESLLQSCIHINNWIEKINIIQNKHKV